MTIAGVHHVSFTVIDLERTVAFYRDVVGMCLVGRKRRRAADLGTALFGGGPAEEAAGAAAGAPGAAEILIADMELGGTRVEFIQYVAPASAPYPGDPSVAGSAHIAISTRDIEREYRRLQVAGVRFHTPVRTVRDPDRPVWRWCYFRDPDGICVELVESLEAAEEGRGTSAPGTPLEREIEALQTGDYGIIERQRSGRRLDWLTAHGYPARLDDPLPAIPVSPREAFELLFFDYMELTREEMPVAEETADSIVWLSHDHCPTLEACARLGLDTRQVCRAVSERPVQTFISRLDPRLRFVRDYAAIRPRAAHCREQIVRIDVEALMRVAIAEARAAKAEGNKGYGCVLLMGDRVLARTHDTAVARGDPSLHAEHSAILEAIARWGSPDLTGSLLISTCEPCPMCTGLAVWAGVTTIMFGSSIADTAAMGRSRILVGAAEIAGRAPHVVEVIGGVLKDECDPLYDY